MRLAARPVSLASVPRANSPSRLATVLGWVLVAAGPPLLALPQLGEWFFFDDAVYVTVAREMLRGGVIYADAFDHKPPVIHLVYAGLLWLGAGPEVLRLAIFVGLGASAMLVRLVAREFFEQRVALLVGLTFAGATALVLLSDNGSAEQLMLLPMTGSLWAHLRAVRTGRLRFLFLAGVLAGLAVWTKPVAVFNLGALAGCAFLVPGGLQGSRPLVRLAVLGSGACLVTVAFVAWLGVVAGGAAFDALVTFNMAYGRLVSPEERLSNLVRGVPYALIGFGPLAPVALVGAWLLAREWSARTLVIAMWTLASLAGALSPGFLFGRYMLQLLPSAALLAGIAYEWFGTVDRGRRASVYALAALSLAGAIPTLAALRSYHPRSGPDGMARFVAALRDSGAADDRLFVHGRLPQAYAITGMRPAHPYLFHTVFMARPDLWPQTVEDLRASPPDVLLEDRRPPQPGHPLAHVVTSPEFEAWRDERYEPIHELGQVTIYRLRRD